MMSCSSNSLVGISSDDTLLTSPFASVQVTLISLSVTATSVTIIPFVSLSILDLLEVDI